MHRLHRVITADQFACNLAALTIGIELWILELRLAYTRLSNTTVSDLRAAAPDAPWEIYGIHGAEMQQQEYAAVRSRMCMYMIIPARRTGTLFPPQPALLLRTNSFHGRYITLINFLIFNHAV
ncbi:MAG: hypothetical protein EOP04_13420 [Proteobacteria bacterium]|nr:MAG: hypothetical protein EOP04_13420 [Pseudomonadota bacterium]